ncbi:hypothetical protein VD0002_g1397 [Verticillium dahliae]|uniref:Major facilitator superfamily (MFS) profile domain-containing protein n=1 Tax=Verticillium dahliae TaxID=27337 RepID=A0A2J8F4Q5_VERDA|nr:hypothetical protein VdG2_03533 [Verticillium dahliae VDG2]KAF3357449.1 hypothetical protein VdG1_03237 [Verticillium dahliae VDG1]PNH32504.1 hypothetical protein BJF96_g4354 [Verticillium dahliae]PNH54670.1 hypothetical protein VD0003_g2853 [Verticillium dahliae]PNH68719.1 hypothetical protein VD0002_g1397 [Verticillium dahliae]
MSNPRRRREPKLPVQQLAILAIARFAEPLAMTSVFPYLPEMIRSFGVEQNKVAKWAGITSAAFSLSQSACAVPWGKASDTFGRKPTIIAGLTSTMTLFLVWGFSTSLTMAIIVRILLGGGNGNVGIIRTMVAEMVTEKELQPRAFSVMPLVWTIGSVFGPAFGGIFVQPVERFPALFGNSTFFKTFPFALPNMIMSIFFLVSLGSAIFFLHETLESKRGSKDWGLQMGQRLTRTFRRSHHDIRARRTSFVDGEATAPLLPAMIKAPKKSMITTKPTMSEVFTRQTVIGLVAYTFLALHAVAFDQVVPVFLNYPIIEHTPENTSLPFQFSGGFGLGSERIGPIFAFYGVACGAIQFLFFPVLCSRFGTLRCYRACAYVSPFVYILMPYTVLLPTTTTRYIALLSLMLVKGFAAIVGFPCMTILLTNSASSLRILGTLNGFATMFSGLGRAVGPAGAGVAFSWGVERGYVITAWWLLSFCAVVGAIPAMMLTEGDGPAPSTETTDDEADEETLLEDDDSDVVTTAKDRNEGEEGEYSSEDEPLLGREGSSGRTTPRAGYDSITTSKQ